MNFQEFVKEKKEWIASGLAALTFAGCSTDEQKLDELVNNNNRNNNSELVQPAENTSESLIIEQQQSSKDVDLSNSTVPSETPIEPEVSQGIQLSALEEKFIDLILNSNDDRGSIQRLRGFLKEHIEVAKNTSNEEFQAYFDDNLLERYRYRNNGHYLDEIDKCTRYLELHEKRDDLTEKMEIVNISNMSTYMGREMLLRIRGGIDGKFDTVVDIRYNRTLEHVNERLEDFLKNSK